MLSALPITYIIWSGAKPAVIKFPADVLIELSKATKLKSVRVYDNVLTELDAPIKVKLELVNDTATLGVYTESNISVVLTKV